MRLPSKWSCTAVNLCLGLTAVSAATHNVSVTSFSFTPRVLTVTQGDTVVWSGASGSHTVSPRAGVSEPFCGGGAVFSCMATFNTVGSFPYQCNFHAGFGFNMTGVVHVAAAPGMPPLVLITNPPNNALFVAPATVPVGVSASDSDGTVASVQLLTNGVAAATNTVLPFGFTLTNLAAGNYVLRARALDNQSLSATSAPVTVRVLAPGGPALSFSRGSNGPIQFQFSTVAGVNYVVEGATLTNFSPVVTNPGSGGVLQFSETNGGLTQRTYRLRLQ